MEQLKKHFIKGDDIWRDTPVRLLGYANEVGESFRYVFPGFVKPSYGIAFGYCFCDMLDKGYKQYQQKAAMQKIILSSCDAIVWQVLASVFIPGFVINRTVKIASFCLKQAKASPPIVKWVPVGVGLLTIPFIVEPIDHSVDFAMDNTVRKLF